MNLKDVKNIISTLRSIKYSYSTSLSSVDLITDSLNSLADTASSIGNGLKFLGILPEDTDVEGTVKSSVETLNNNINEPMSSLKSSMKGVIEYIDNIYKCIDKIIDEGTTYIENIENIIRSTINKYLNIIQNAINNINSLINKIQNTINTVVYKISVLPAVLLNNITSNIRYSYDKLGKKNIASKLLEPVINKSLSSITTSMLDKFSGITNATNKISNTLYCISSQISGKIGNSVGIVIDKIPLNL